MNKDLLRVSLRQQALYLPDGRLQTAASPVAMGLCAELRQLGYAVSEPLLHALNAISDEEQQELLSVVNEVMGCHLNWVPLVRGWQVPTGESLADHFVTALANLLKSDLPIEGTTLSCGHLIPDGTFPLERYTGCPFCGRPFVTAPGETYRGQGSKLKLLTLWGDEELDRYFASLLASPVPLDATQCESVTTLLKHRPLPDVEIAMKETRMLVISGLVQAGRDDEAARLFASPHDVLRYLWYCHTGRLQLLEPRTLLYIRAKNLRYERNTDDDILLGVMEERKALRLHYDRRECRRVARWLNGLSMPIDQQLESMHPKRRMWVRFVRALRLTEMARKPGFERLRLLLDRFYRQDYDVWAGQVERSREAGDCERTLQLLRQRPGLFARSLFATMLRFRPQPVVDAFRQVADQVPPRLLLSLGYQSQLYFDRTLQRVARPLSGTMVHIQPHPLLARYTDDQLLDMQQQVLGLFLETMRRRFDANSPLSSLPSPLSSLHYIYIDPRLDDIPVSVGDRSATIQDTSAALQGTRFAVEGDSVRLFLQWGRDLPAQPLDMDLSCHILKDDGVQLCSYFSLNVPGAKHSGDIREIPDYVGTAEYIELSLPELQQAGAYQVVFTCNAYSAGALQPNLMVGWMDSRFPMQVSNETGVAYDPSTVSHIVRISETNLAKGLVFGVLDVAKREITWLEVPFDGQTVLSVNTDTIGAYLRRLRAKPTIGQLLRLKAEAQHLTLTERPEDADEAYTYQWALDTAAVNGLLLG